VSEKASNPVRLQREHIRRMDRELRQRDELLRGMDEHVSSLVAHIRLQRIEILLQEMGGSREWAPLYEMAAAEGRVPGDPDEFDLADWIRSVKLAPNVTKPLPVRLQVVSSLEDEAS
jgi:hypothetical protein